MSNILKVYAPYDQSLIKEIPLVGKAEAEKALETANQLFLDQHTWIPAHKKKSILNKVASLMNDQIHELALTAAQEGGKPYTDSKVEVLRAIDGIRIANEEISHLGGKQVPMGLMASSTGRIAFTTREPIGVVLSISAFNHPLNLIVHQTITAFAAGCPVIIKPAPNTPISCLAFIEILKKAGVPEGWVQCIICDNETAEFMVTDNRVNYFSFIGSARVGWYLKSKLAPGTRCALEHGGVAPVIVEKDADLESMLPLLIKGSFYHAGQVCVSVQRIYVQHDMAEDLAAEIVIKANALKVGDPLDEETDVGPLISPEEVDRIDTWVKEAEEKGAKILCGGKRLSATCYSPTVLFDPPKDAKMSKEEVFGPVVCIYPFRDRKEAIQLANQLDYHFQAAVFTKNLDIALECVNQLNATCVMVNDHTAFRVDWMPFGGRDASGEGMGGIPYAIQEMTRIKMMVIKSDSIL
ncbi:aldehyde dehydrogenase family protein [Anditalea andensis]|uniref:Aldehyde dehydrogenase n=1 Tax=Anditalea andensis TaxID=1048983 RepID=A0A074L3N5_9BACT|nr:aldehyde dehydrogenase family protein [Anditalea andensis]KEO75789.1 aldehyde dehydrogenase [Anditalea andensis]